MKKYKVGKNTIILHLLVVTGSVLHCVDNDTSDIDYEGVFTWSLDSVSGFNQSLPDTLVFSNTEHEDWIQLKADIEKDFSIQLSTIDDISFYEARSFIKGLQKNILRSLDIINADQIFYSSPFMESIRQEKMIFKDLGLAINLFSRLSEKCEVLFLKNIKKLAPEVSVTEFDSKYVDLLEAILNYEHSNLVDKFLAIKARKNFARVFHLLFLLEEYISFGSYSPRLRSYDNLQSVKMLRTKSLSPFFIRKLFNQRDSLLQFFSETKATLPPVADNRIYIERLLKNINLCELAIN